MKSLIIFAIGVILGAALVLGHPPTPAHQPTGEFEQVMDSVIKTQLHLWSEGIPGGTYKLPRGWVAFCDDFQICLHEIGHVFFQQNGLGNDAETRAALIAYIETNPDEFYWVSEYSPSTLEEVYVILWTERHSVHFVP